MEGGNGTTNNDDLFSCHSHPYASVIIWFSFYSNPQQFALVFSMKCTVLSGDECHGNSIFFFLRVSLNENF